MELPAVRLVEHLGPLPSVRRTPKRLVRIPKTSRAHLATDSDEHLAEGLHCKPVTRQPKTSSAWDPLKAKERWLCST